MLKWEISYCTKWWHNVCVSWYMYTSHNFLQWTFSWCSPVWGNPISSYFSFQWPLTLYCKGREASFIRQYLLLHSRDAILVAPLASPEKLLLWMNLALLPAISFRLLALTELPAPTVIMRTFALLSFYIKQFKSGSLKLSNQMGKLVYTN